MGVNIGGGPAGQWFRVHAVSPAARGTADADYAAVLPAALHAARSRRPFIAGWLSRGSGAPLELVTNAGPLPAPSSPASAPAASAPAASVPAASVPAASVKADSAAADGVKTDRAVADSKHGGRSAEAGRPLPGAPGPGELARAGRDVSAEVTSAASGRTAEDLLFPWGSRGAVMDVNMLADLDQLVWAPCPGRQVPLSPDAVVRAARATGVDGLDLPTLFESALQTLMDRPFGWLIVADPTELLEAETAELRNQVTVLRQYEDEHARFDADRA